MREASFAAPRVWNEKQTHLSSDTFHPVTASMRSIFAVLALVFALVGAAHAQWLNVPKAGIPRTADGGPDLNAVTPRTGAGKPDLAAWWKARSCGVAPCV